jgi:hypothetical protein
MGSVTVLGAESPANLESDRPSADASHLKLPIAYMSGMTTRKPSLAYLSACNWLF